MVLMVSCSVCVCVCLGILWQLVCFTVSLQNKGGETPLDVAKKYTQFKCVSLLGGTGNLALLLLLSSFSASLLTDQLETEEGAPETLGTVTD